MSYRVGLFGVAPYVFCDFKGCNVRRYIDGLPPAWFLDRKPPPKWRGVRAQHDDNGDMVLARRDYCPAHRAATQSTEGKE